MNSCYRLIPRILSKNVRRLFADNPKDASSADYWRKLGVTYFRGVTESYGRRFETIRVGNARVLLITANSFFGGGDGIVYCAFRVGVGFEDDPKKDQCQGLAHLFEHIIAHNVVFGLPSSNISFRGNTYEFESVYSFIVNEPNFHFAIEELTIELFSTWLIKDLSVDYEENKNRELQLVDNEFFQFHNSLTSIYKVFAMLKLQNINLGKFGCGNYQTLTEGKYDLQQGFETLRDYCRQRPLNVCIYSTQSLSLPAIFKSLNHHQFLTKKAAHMVEATSTTRDNTDDLSEHLFILKGDDNLLELNLLYPMNRQLNKNESNTFQFLIKMIQCELDGHLTDYLLKEKLATGCAALLNSPHRIFMIIVDLTDKGLENVQIVSCAVINYLKFLYEKWAQLEINGYRNREKEVKSFMKDAEKESNYAKHVATHLYGEIDENNKFDEERLCTPLEIDEERKLIAEQILQDKNVVRIIVGQQPNQVQRVLRDHHPDFFQFDQAVQEEPIFKAKFIHFQTDLFKHNHVTNNFEVVELNDLKLDGSVQYVVAAPITKPTDVIFQYLFATYLELQSITFRAILEHFYPGCTYIETRDFTVHYKATGVYYETLKAHTNSLDRFQKMTNDDFNWCKTLLKRSLSKEMANSQKFAESLMNTAVLNLHCTKLLSISIPMRYNHLMSTERSDYLDYFHRIQNYEQDDSMFEYSDHIDVFDESFIMKSMNKNERITVTQLFCETNLTRNDNALISLHRKMSSILHEECNKLLYAPECTVVTRAGRTGILLNIKSVQSKLNQKSDIIRKLCKDIVTKKLALKLQTTDYDERALHFYLKCRTVLIQIIGHTKPDTEENEFDVEFSNWYKTYEKKLSTIGQPES